MTPDLFAELVRSLIHLGTLGPVVLLLAWMMMREVRGLRDEVVSMHKRLAILLDRVGARDTSTTKSPTVKA
jgi:hypothetical protein